MCFESIRDAKIARFPLIKRRKGKLYKLDAVQTDDGFKTSGGFLMVYLT